MTIIVFLIDTSSSMNQRVYFGGRPTLLDVAKGAVETFVKVRQRSPESRGDRYMLLTFEDPPNNIKAAWKENLTTFMNELKNLQCTGLTTMGAALKQTFDVLNINRMQTGIDTYGQGRCPFYLEPSVIVVITDGGRLTNSQGIQDEFILPMHSPIPGCELTREPFRWDQRLFSLVLRLPGTPAIERDTGLVPSDVSPIDAMCEVTGGRSYAITSHRMLMQCIDSLVSKVQSGVVINFEKIGPDPPPITDNRNFSADCKNEIVIEDGADPQWDKDLINPPHPDKMQNGVSGWGQEVGGGGWARPKGGVGPQTRPLVPPGPPLGQPPNGGPPIPPAGPVGPAAWHSCRKLIYVPRSAQKGFPVGFWPIPESFWPDLKSSSLPPRSAHPNVKFTCTSQDPMVIANLPFDKYELEPSPLTQFILARKQPTICWQVFVPNSYKNSDVGHPFGYLKASTNLTCVNLFVMPYNYPVLLPLLDELFKIHRQKPTNDWRNAFTNYLRTMPPYYCGPLRRALTRMGASTSIAQNLIPDNMDNCLSYSVLNYLKKLKDQAKIEYEKMCNEVGSKAAGMKMPNPPEGVRVLSRSPLKKDLLSHPMLQDKFNSLREQLNEFGGFVVGVGDRRERGAQSYRNAFDIPRSSLLDQVIRMRHNFLHSSSSNVKLLDQDVVHSMPISQMGNYQEYLKKTPQPLREVETTPVRQHMFGNPFKIDKRMMVDEADMDPMGGSSGGGSRGSKRGFQGVEVGPGGLGVAGRPPPRKKGPLARDFVLPRSPGASPCPSPRPESPCPSPSPPPVCPTPPLPVNLAPVLPSPVYNSVSAPVPVPVVQVPVYVPPPAPSPPIPTIPIIPTIPVIPNNPPLLNGDIDEDEKESPRSPSPPGDVGAPPVLQPYDGLPPPAAPVPGKVEPPPSLSPPPSPPEAKSLSQIRKHNLELRTLAYKEVRRPGRNHQPLFDHLEKMKGTVQMKINLIKDIINESLRFKRRTLASHLDKQLKALMNSNSGEIPNCHQGNNGAR